MTGEQRVGFLVDDASLPNITTQLRLLGTELAARYSLDLFYHDSVDPALEPLFTLHQVSVDHVRLPAPVAVTDVLARISGYALAGRRYVRKQSPTALVGFTNPPVLGTAAGLATVGSATTAIYRHSGDSFNEYRQLDGVARLPGYCHYNGVGRLALRLCDVYVVLGDNGRAELIDRSIPADRIYTVPPAVDRERFSPAGPAMSPASSGTVVLFVGRLNARKGVDRLERIVERVLASTDDTEFVIVGEGPLRERLERFPDDQVHVLGRIPHEELPEHYRAADLLIHPSKVEGLPNVLLEAAACGVHTITSPVGEMAAYADHVCETVPEFVSTILELDTDAPTRWERAALPDREHVGEAFRTLLRERRD